MFLCLHEVIEPDWNINYTDDKENSRKGVQERNFVQVKVFKNLNDINLGRLRS